MNQTEKLASADYALKQAGLQSLINDIIRGGKRLMYTDQEILDAPVAKLKDQMSLDAVGLGGDVLGGAAGAATGAGLSALINKLLLKGKGGYKLLGMLGAIPGGLVGTKLNDPFQQEDLINKKLDLGYPQGLNLSVKKSGYNHAVSQTEKLASAVYLIKSAGMQEKLLGATNYIKQLFNPASDDEVWASRFKAKPEDFGSENFNKVQGGKILGMLAGGGLGLMAGRAGGGSLLKNLIKNLHLKSMGRMGKSDRLFREANDLDFATKNMNRYKQEGKDLGGSLGLLTGMLGGGIAGDAGVTSQLKPDMIRNLRASGYPQK